MSKKKNDVLEEQAMVIASKWETPADVRQTLLEHLQLSNDGKISLEELSALNKEASKVIKRMKKQIKEIRSK